MARLHEYQGKALLAEHGITVPRGEAVTSGEDAARVARDIGGRVVVKVQAWTTSRAAQGGVAFATTADEARAAAQRMLAMTFGNFPVTHVLVEEALDIQHELFVSLSIDDAAKAPVLLLDLHGGSGIEERADSVARLPIGVVSGLDPAAVAALLETSAIRPTLHEELVSALVTIVNVARGADARSLEVNPLVTTADGHVVAADCRITIDDYAVFRHPELGIEIARELDHPATELERIAYRVEQDDHRGTFYFAQLSATGDGPRIGFHGAGGGGSMMSMDAVTHEGFALANFCDTSGNPSAAKVYRAARIIMSQPDLVGYFGSGSGVASQEQFHSAYGLAKAFTEVRMDRPVVIRLGGNSEDRAVEILESVGADLPATIEGYRKDDTPAACAARFRELVSGAAPATAPLARTIPAFAGAAYGFPINGGSVSIDHDHCDDATSAFIVEHSNGLLRLNESGHPVLAVEVDEVATKDSELIALEIECLRAGRPAVFVDLPVPGLDSLDPFDIAMSIIIDRSKKVLVQGITGREGRARTRLMREFGTNVVAGCTPGKGGQDVEGIPVFDAVAEAVQAVGGVDISVVFVPARLVKYAAIEAIEAGVRLLLLVPDRVPLWDTMAIAAAADAHGSSFIGPNTLGVISPGQAVIGMIGGRAESARQWFNEPVPGRTVGVISRSGGMTSSCGYYLSRRGVGLSTLVHVGGDSVIGLAIPDVALLFENDPTTDAIVIFGEIGGSQEERLAEHMAAGRVSKPVVAYIGGKAAKEGTRFSHAGAIIEGNRGTHHGKATALREAGATVVEGFGDLPDATLAALGVAASS